MHILFYSRLYESHKNYILNTIFLNSKSWHIMVLTGRYKNRFNYNIIPYVFIFSFFNTRRIL